MSRLVFNLLIVPLATALRLVGVDPMGLRRTEATTYWKRRRSRVRMTSPF
jgi:hypothetical protein